MEKIAYLYTGMNRGGAQKVLIDLADKIRGNEFSSIVISDVGELIEDLNRKNIKHIMTPLKRKNIKYLLQSLYIIRKTVRTENISIIHSHHRYTTLLANIATVFSKVKVVHTEHSVFPNKNTFNFRGKNIISVSEEVKNSLINNGVKKEYINLIYNGIEVNNNEFMYNLKDELKVNKECILVGVLARLVEGKGHKLLLESLHSIKLKNDNFKVVFIGDGPEKNNLLSLIQKFKLEEKVILLGNRNDVEKIIESFDFFVLPSYFEGLPISVLECMSKSKIVVATNVGGNKEVIIEGENGFLIDSGNKEQLASKIEYCIDNLGMVKVLGKNAKETVTEKFSMEKFIENHRHYYKNI